MSKKILALLVSAMMVFSFTACSPETDDIAEKDDEKIEAENDEEISEESDSKDVPSEITLEPDGEDEKTNVSSEIYTPEQFYEFIKEYVDITNYEDTTTDKSDSLYLDLKDDREEDYDLDYTIKLNGNAKIEMPMAFKDFTSQGWGLKNQKDGKVDLKSGYSTSALCKYKDSVITVYSVNLKDTTSTYEEGYIYRVLFDLYSSNDVYKSSLDSAPQFAICGSINNNSTIKDIISTLGEPTNIYYTIIADAFSKIELKYQNSDAYNNLGIILNQDGTKIVSVDYSCSASK